MPYTRFKKGKGGITVYKKVGGKVRKAFTAHTKSIKQAKRTARIREWYRKKS